MRTPKYRIRPDRDLAFVEVKGRRITLPGRANSPESLAAYGRIVHQVCRERAGQLEQAHQAKRETWELTIAELAAAWLDWAKGYYVPVASTRSNAYSNCRYAIRPLIALFGATHVQDFGPPELRQVREAAITGRWVPSSGKPPQPWCRNHVNGCINRIKQMFRWGVEHGMVEPAVAAMVGSVASLRRGRSVARETEPVGPVPDTAVDATLPYLSAVVADMVRIQRLTGMRSDNLCAMRPQDIDRSGAVWLYRPAVHKGSQLGLSLVVPLGPRCQAILLPYLSRPADLPCFSPREAWRPRDGKRAPRARYATASYRRAVERGCEEAFGMPALLRRIPASLDPVERRRLLDESRAWRAAHVWHPHQLRHNAVQAAKHSRGLDSARAYVGHAMIETTQLYEERDLALALEIAGEIG